MEVSSESQLTHEDLLTFIGGEADSETKRRIAAEMEVEGSKVRRWLERLSYAASVPLNVAWGRLISENGWGKEQADEEALPETECTARATGGDADGDTGMSEDSKVDSGQV